MFQPVPLAAPRPGLFRWEDRAVKIHGQAAVPDIRPHVAARDFDACGPAYDLAGRILAFVNADRVFGHMIRAKRESIRERKLQLSPLSWTPGLFRFRSRQVSNGQL